MTSNIIKNDQDLVHLAEQRDTSGAVERHLLGKLQEVKLQPECGHRHVCACLKTPRSSACNASLPQVPVPSRAACWHVCHIRFLDTDSKKGLHFNISNFRNFFRHFEEGNYLSQKKKTKKTESDYRAHATAECARRCRALRVSVVACTV